MNYNDPCPLIDPLQPMSDSAIELAFTSFTPGAIGFLKLFSGSFMVVAPPLSDMDNVVPGTHVKFGGMDVTHTSHPYALLTSMKEFEVEIVGGLFESGRIVDVTHNPLLFNVPVKLREVEGSKDGKFGVAIGEAIMGMQKPERK